VIEAMRVSGVVGDEMEEGLSLVEKDQRCDRGRLQEMRRVLMGKKVVTGGKEAVLAVVRKRGVDEEVLKLGLASYVGWERVSMKGLENVPKTVEIMGA
jgi:hypothetical protein